MKPSIETIEEEGYTPLDCKWCYWARHVTTEYSAVCLVDACRTGDPSKAFGVPCEYDEDSGCPCDDYEEPRGDEE